MIAGFGETEVFPALASYQTDGYIGEQVKIGIDSSMKIEKDNRSSISAFAQREMVNRFMDGIDPDFHEYLHNLFGESLLGSCLQLLETYGDERFKTDEIRAKIKQAAEEAMQANAKQAMQYRGDFFASPVIDMVAMLPKDELASLAESLVELTSLKRHVSHDVESVGGPIDVALISKSDGFIWIKRKHYFRPELNPQFTRTYMRDIQEEDSDADAGNDANAGGQAKKHKAKARKRRR